MNQHSRDPDYRERTHGSFRRQGFMQHLGASLIDVRPGYVEVEVAYADRLSQQHGYFHGGVVATLADVAGGYAAFSLLDAASSNVTVEFKINLLAPAEGTHLRARSSVLRSGRTLTVCESRVVSISAHGAKHCATALSTFMALPGRAERAGCSPRVER